MAAKQQQSPKEKMYYFFNEAMELFLEGTEKEFLEDVGINGNFPDTLFYKIDPIHVKKIKVESKIVEI